MNQIQVGGASLFCCSLFGHHSERLFAFDIFPDFSASSCWGVAKHIECRTMWQLLVRLWSTAPAGASSCGATAAALSRAQPRLSHASASPPGDSASLPAVRMGRSTCGVLCAAKPPASLPWCWRGCPKSVWCVRVLPKPKGPVFYQPKTPLMTNFNSCSANKGAGPL